MAVSSGPGDVPQARSLCRLVALHRKFVEPRGRGQEGRRRSPASGGGRPLSDRTWKSAQRSSSLICSIHDRNPRKGTVSAIGWIPGNGHQLSARGRRIRISAARRPLRSRRRDQVHGAARRDVRHQAWSGQTAVEPGGSHFHAGAARGSLKQPRQPLFRRVAFPHTDGDARSRTGRSRPQAGHRGERSPPATMIAEGLVNRRIAIGMGLSEDAVANRLIRLLARAGLRSRTQVATRMLTGLPLSAADQLPPRLRARKPGPPRLSGGSAQPGTPGTRPHHSRQVSLR